MRRYHETKTLPNAEGMRKTQNTRRNDAKYDTLTQSMTHRQNGRET